MAEVCQGDFQAIGSGQSWIEGSLGSGETAQGYVARPGRRRAPHFQQPVSILRPRPALPDLVHRVSRIHPADRSLD